LNPIASEQDGFFSSAQAQAVGVDDGRLARLLQDGYVERSVRGVYRVVTGVTIVTHVPEWLYVRYLALDAQRLPWERGSSPGVVVSHSSAADLLGLGSLPADIAEFTSVRRKSTVLPAVRIRQAGLPPQDWSWRESGRIPVTTAARTAVDLALVGVGRDYVEAIVAQALQRQLATLAELRSALARRRGHARTASVAWLDGFLAEVGNHDE